MIKKPSLSILALIGIVIHFSIISYAQNTSPVVEKSDQKVIYQGNIYYIHKVKQGHTLYSICKTYQVTVQDIKMANPSAVLDPLSIGQVLRVPIAAGAESAPEVHSGDFSKNREAFIFHKVQAGETTFFLHKKYNVPLTSIYRYNPGTESGLAKGQIVKIPKQHLLKPQPDFETGKQEKKIFYTVQQGDTLYRIAQDYGITISNLVNANENLRWGLKTGQVLTIPLKTGYDGMFYQGAADSVFMVSEMAKLSARQCDSIASAYKMRTPVKVALVLPLFADERFTSVPDTDGDTLDSNGVGKKQKAQKGRIAIEFYEGLLLAVDSLKKNNMDINLFVYDSGADTNKVKKILDDLEIVHPDLILGPFLPDNIALMNKFSTEKKIPFVPPLMKDDSSLIHNQNLFQVLPPYYSELEIWSEYLSKYHRQNILFIYKHKNFKQTETDQFKNILLRSFKNLPDFDTLLFTEIRINDSLKYNLGRHLSNSLENIVIVASSYEPEVSDVLTKLYFVHKSYKIKVFGMPGWQKFKSVRIEHFHDMNVTLFTPFYIDYSDPQVKSFVLKCRSKLKYEPYLTTSKGTGINYTFLGYDLGLYFISALHKFGDYTCDCVQFYQPSLMLSSYSFNRNKVHGFNENKGISIIRYREDFTIKRREIQEGDIHF